MSGMKGERDVALARVIAQGLAVPQERPVHELVAWLGGVQAQDFPGATEALALRCPSGSTAEVQEAFSAGTIVRSWPLRGTLHIVAAADLRWMLELFSAKLIAGAASRRRQLGIGPDELRRAGEITYGSLAGGRALRRSEMTARWASAGLETGGQRAYHLFWHLAQIGLVCWGPVVGGQQQVVLVDEWVSPTPARPRAEALGHLARRYFLSHGPATAKDLSRWAGLGAADLGLALANVGPEVEPVAIDGRAYWASSAILGQLQAARRQARGVFLLPSFDELIMGYADRTATVPADREACVFPTRNGVARPVVVFDGQVVGTWSRPSSGRGSVEVAFVTPVPDSVRRTAQAH
jgi:Winged helix DNA-binding domain